MSLLRLSWVCRIRRGAMATAFTVSAMLVAMCTAGVRADDKNDVRSPTTTQVTSDKTVADKTDKVEKKMEKATFGGGCFWCVEAVLQRVEGVEKVESGYAGGQTKNPTYQSISSGRTGHAEVVQVTFDPSKVSYLKLLEIFMKTHDPTTLNRQGHDVGTQYRSIILTHNDQQAKEAAEMKAQLDKSGIFSDPIVTQIEPLKEFYRGEDYHQNYFNQNRSQPYCQIVVKSKVEKLEKLFKELMKKDSK